MMHSSCRAAIGKLLVVAALATAAVAVTPVAQAEDVTKNFPVNGRPTVRVDTNDGSVRITSGDTKEVRFRVEYSGYVLNKDLRVDAARTAIAWSLSLE